MNQAHDALLLLANDRIRERIAEAAAERSRPRRQPRPSLRRSIGHRIIRIGARLAEEPHLQPARPR